MLDVLIAMHDPMTRIGLRAALDEAEGTRAVGETDDPARLDDLLRTHEPHVLLLDVRFRRADPELIPRLASSFPDVRILVHVAHHAEECILRHFLEAGSRTRLSPEATKRLDECCLTSLRGDAHGCLPTEATAEEVVRAVQAVAAGEVAAAPWLLAVTRGGLSGDGEAITPREVEVMALLAEGLGNKGIARRMGIREQTVKNHVARIMRKLGLHNRVQVGVLATEHHLTLDEGALPAENGG